MNKATTMKDSQFSLLVFVVSC